MVWDYLDFLCFSYFWIVACIQPMLLELGKQNPQVLRLINENQAEFFRLINEAGGGEGAEGYVLKKSLTLCLFSLFNNFSKNKVFHITPRCL